MRIRIKASLAFGLVACGVSALAGGGTPVAATVDFSEKVGVLRPALHSSGFGPIIADRLEPKDTTAALKAMNLTYARTHDWSHVNTNERVCDTHFIFPLPHLDPSKPENYYFAATDELLRRTREELGMKVFFRLGTSIEHSGLVHFNTAIPDDFDKTAEIYAAIVRHYNRGWANGFNWDIRYWEVWNEPDACNNMWTIPGEDDNANDKANRPKRLRLYREFLVKVIRRLKAEFPEIKVGGPAFTAFRLNELKEILVDCKAAGVKPDFLSWHFYGSNVDWLMNPAAKMRAACDELGFTDCELVMNEWHYMVDGGFKATRDPDPEAYRRAWEGPGSLNGVDAAVFTLAALGAFQTSAYDHAYYYGCGHDGAWGFRAMPGNRKHKPYYSLCLFGSVLRDFTDICRATSNRKGVRTLAVRAADGRVHGLLVTDYRGPAGDLVLDVKGVPANVVATARTIDLVRNDEPCACRWSDGKLVLGKPAEGSAAWFVAFAPKGVKR